VRVTFKSWVSSCLCRPFILWVFRSWWMLSPFSNREWIKTFSYDNVVFCVLFSNTCDTHFGFHFRVFSLLKISKDLLWLFKILRFFNNMSNNNIHATLIICISLWRKIFYHGDWFRRWPIVHCVWKKIKYLFEVLCFDFFNVNKDKWCLRIFINLSRSLD
jgi:hypothetical protein